MVSCRHLLAPVLVAGCLLAVTPSSSTATTPSPGWLAGRGSLTASPRSVVAAAVDDELLEVVVTRTTPTGPRFESLPADDVREAEQLVARAQDDPHTAAVSMAQPARIAATDTYAAEQWALSYLKASAARTMSRGSGVVVAVIDTGVQASHPDLSGRVLNGFSPVGGSGTVDDNGHGTHVAGIIAALAGNGRGVAGLADHATILPVKVFDPTGVGTSTDVAHGITQAVNAGAQVINLSLALGGDDAAVRSAVAYAINRGVVVVAAAGNAPCPSQAPVYPAAYPGVLAVGAVERTGASAPFVCSGGWVDVSAPGRTIMSTWKGSTYKYASGTSMAAPHVAAIAALLIDEIGPTWTSDGVTRLIEGTATDRGAKGRDPVYGAGVIDPVRALRHIDTRTVFGKPPSSVQSGGQVTITGRLVRTDGSGVGQAPVTLAATLDGARRTWPVMTDSSGSFSIRVAVPHLASFAAEYAGSPTTDDSRSALAFSRVTPAWSKSTSPRSASLTVRSAYGQTVVLEQYSSRKWRVKASIRIATPGQVWTVPTGRGTWRFRSVSNSKLSAARSYTWRS